MIHLWLLPWKDHPVSNQTSKRTAGGFLSPPLHTLGIPLLPSSPPNYLQPETNTEINGSLPHFPAYKSVSKGASSISSTKNSKRHTVPTTVDPQYVIPNIIQIFAEKPIPSL